MPPVICRGNRSAGISRSPEWLPLRQAGMMLTFGPLAVAALALLLG